MALPKPSSAFQQFHYRPPLVTTPLSLFRLFSSTTTSSAAPRSGKAAFGTSPIFPSAVPEDPSLLPSLSSSSFYLAFHRTLCHHGAGDQEYVSFEESDEDDRIYEEEDELEEEVDDDEVEGGGGGGGGGEFGVVVGNEGLMRLSVKEKKELASYANSLGKKLKYQLVGKSGVTESVGRSFVETLEANELLKIKIHRTCPGELEDVVKRLEMLTGSVVVSQIGRTVIIYRPSLTKMKAEEEKKKQARRVFTRREPKSRFLPFKNRIVSRPSGHHRRRNS